MLEKASAGKNVAPDCVLCDSALLELESCREENAHLRTILSWVSCNEPQLGMMLKQCRRGIGGPGLGFAIGGKDESAFGKIGECSGMNPSEKPDTTTKSSKVAPPKPTECVTKDGVFVEPPRAPPQKQVWVAKPNHLRNPLDTLPDISEDPLPTAKAKYQVGF